MGSPFHGPYKESPTPGQNACALFLRWCRSEWAAAAREIECAERNPPLCAAPDLANVSLPANISAAALSDASNAPYILYAMARTNSLVNGQHSADAKPGPPWPQMRN